MQTTCRQPACLFFSECFTGSIQRFQASNSSSCEQQAYRNTVSCLDVSYVGKRSSRREKRQTQDFLHLTSNSTQSALRLPAICCSCTRFCRGACFFCCFFCRLLSRLMSLCRRKSTGTRPCFDHSPPEHKLSVSMARRTC